MKKYLILLLAAALMLLCACADTQSSDERGTAYPIYFLAPSGTAQGGDAIQCSEEFLDLHENAVTESIAAAVVNRLISGPKNSNLLSPFPQGTHLISLSIRNGRAYVDLSGISLLDGIDLTLADYCLTLSLTAIEGIDSISITGNGNLMLQQPRRFFYPYDVLLSSEDSLVQQVQVTLFFLDSTGILIGENHTLDIYEGETQSAVLLTALLAGPKSSELVSVIPEDFIISSIKVEDGVCLIHIPMPVLQNLPEDEYTQNLILWSLAESLYSLEYINEIRLLTDGEELDYFGNIPVSIIAQRPQG